MNTKKDKVVSVLILLLFIALIAVMCYDLVPILKEVAENTKDESKMITYIQSHGRKGMPILAGLQALQVILAFFPAAAIQILAGLCYGVWLGSILCIIGYVFGNVLVFSALRQFGKVFSPFTKKTKPKKKKKIFNLDHIEQMQHPEFLAFFLYLLPGIPNGFLPYLFASSNISFVKYLISVTAASIPSVFICAWLGERISKGDYTTAIILGVVVVAIAVLFFVFKNKIFAWMEKSNLFTKMKEEKAETH